MADRLCESITSMLHPLNTIDPQTSQCLKPCSGMKKAASYNSDLSSASTDLGEDGFSCSNNCESKAFGEKTRKYQEITDQDCVRIQVLFADLKTIYEELERFIDPVHLREEAKRGKVTPVILTPDKSSLKMRRPMHSRTLH